MASQRRRLEAAILAGDDAAHVELAGLVASERALDDLSPDVTKSATWLADLRERMGACRTDGLTFAAAWQREALDRAATFGGRKDEARQMRQVLVDTAEEWRAAYEGAELSPRARAVSKLEDALPEAPAAGFIVPAPVTAS